jgi:hypothetical protein
MVDGIRFPQLTESVANMRQQQEAQQRAQENQRKILEDIPQMSNMAKSIRDLTNVQGRNSHMHQDGAKTTGGQHERLQTRTPKLKFSRFDGENPSKPKGLAQVVKALDFGGITIKFKV